MTFTQSVIQSVGIVIIIILLGNFLRNINVIEEKNAPLFAKIITQITLPALIFSTLSRSVLYSEKLLLAVVMVSSEIMTALIAWGVSIILKLSSPQKGALILGSTFSSSGFLGYAVIRTMYPNNLEALSDAAIVSELGVATTIFTIGVLIAIYFGTAKYGHQEIKKEALKFFYSPIFISLVAGIIFSFIPIPENNWIIAGIYKLLSTISAANTLLVCLTIGIMIHFKDFRRVIFVVTIAIILKLILQPLFSSLQADIYNFPQLWKQIVVIESSMPTAAMVAIFSKRYGCDTELTTILIFATFVSSILTMITMIVLLGQ